jgi:hypothetical protein
MDDTTTISKRTKLFDLEAVHLLALLASSGGYRHAHWAHAGSSLSKEERATRKKKRKQAEKSRKRNRK